MCVKHLGRGWWVPLLLVLICPLQVYSQTEFRIEIDDFGLEYDNNTLTDMLIQGPGTSAATGGNIGIDGVGVHTDGTPAGSARFYEDDVLIADLDEFFFVDVLQTTTDLIVIGGNPSENTGSSFGFDLIYAEQDTIDNSQNNDAWIALNWNTDLDFDITVTPHPAFGTLAPSIDAEGEVNVDGGTTVAGLSAISHWIFPSTVDLSYKTNNFVSNAVVNSNILDSFDHAPDGRGSNGFSAIISGTLIDPPAPLQSTPEPGTLVLAMFAATLLAAKRST